MGGNDQKDKCIVNLLYVFMRKDLKGGKEDEDLRPERVKEKWRK